MEVLDSVIADTLNSGDCIRYEGFDYRILYIESSKDFLLLGVEPLDNSDEDELILDWDEYVDLVGYAYEG